MYSCEECGKDLGTRAKMYPMFLDDGNCDEPYIFAICSRCINKFQLVEESE